MLIIETSKNIRFGYHSGYEFNDPTRNKIYIIRFLFFTFLLMSSNSDISKTFHSAHTVDDLSWVEAVQKEKEKWDNYYHEYWRDEYFEMNERLKTLAKHHENEVKKYKNAYHDVLNLARGLRTLERNGIDVLEKLENK